MNATTIQNLHQVAATQRDRQAIVTAGLASLQRLIPIAQQYSGQSRVVGQFLLGLYNGQDYPFDMTTLRGLDTAVFVDCMNVLLMDNQPEVEVHERVEKGNAIWLGLAEKWAPESVAP